MKEGEPKQTFSEQTETGGRERVELAKQRVLDLRRREKEIADQHEGYQKELCSFLGIDPGTRLARGWAEDILDYADEKNLSPKMFASRLVATIEGAQRVIDGDSEELPVPGTAEWSYLQAVKAMREQTHPSGPEPERVYPCLKEAVAISGKEETQNPTMVNRCQHAAYLWITQELYNLESLWWVIVGKPKQVS